MLRIVTKGSFKNTEAFLKANSRLNVDAQLRKAGEQGVVALSAATPKETGETAASWEYEIVRTRGGVSIEWRNTHVVDGSPIAILLQYGHGTGTGGYVQGRDYINPAMQPIFDRIADEVWKVVTSK